MGTPVKSLDSQTKHLTEAEYAARKSAEASLRREITHLKKPAGMTGRAATYWGSLVQRAADVELLDDLDVEMLAGYCHMLAHRDSLTKLTNKLLAAAATADSKDNSSERTDKLDSLLGKLVKLNRALLSYADKLGFTPQGRVRLAQKRAAAAAMDDPDSDLFGG